VKVDFADHCVPNTSAIHTSLAEVRAQRVFTASEELQLERIQRCKEEPLQRDKCFPTCLRWMEKGRSGGGGGGGDGVLGDAVKFDPYRHCPTYTKYIDENPCMYPLFTITD